MRLCGISSRFQLLSPCTGQVAHALLTRPPLSQRKFLTEISNSQCFVRLACVRHAASVHPEPGSNSLKFVSYPPKRLQSISELVLLYFTKKLSFPGITFLRLFDANLRVPCFFRCLIFKVLVTCLFRRSCAAAPTRLSSARL